MGRMHGRDSLVDMPSGHSVSFAPPHPSRLAQEPGMWRPIVAGSGRAGAGSMSRAAQGDRMNGYPIQLAKVQSPALRDQTLARDRLLDWLAAKIHQRVVLVLADAGYGKTTLLADFSRRT